MPAGSPETVIGDDPRPSGTVLLALEVAAGVEVVEKDTSIALRHIAARLATRPEDTESDRGLRYFSHLLARTALFPVRYTSHLLLRRICTSVPWSNLKST